MIEQIPEGYIKDSHNRLVPISTVKEIDLLRHQTVSTLVENAKTLQATIAENKKNAFDDFTTFLSISADQYGVKLGGSKGNVSLVSYDGKYKVQLAIADNMVFDERLHIAKQMIDECIRAWTVGSNDHIKALIDQAFQVDKEGNINTYRIFRLISLKIDDSKWNKAIEALRDSIKITSTTQYMRFYERVGDSDQFKQISLDFARL